MLEILAIVVFCWLFIGAVRLSFSMTWGLAKTLAVILFILALTTLFGYLMLASGIALLLPIILVAISWGLLKFSR